MSSYFSYPAEGTFTATPASSIEAAEPGDEEIVVEEPTEGICRKLIVRDGRAVGGIVLGAEGDAPALIAAVQDEHDLGPVLDRVRAGDWAALAEAAPA